MIAMMFFAVYAHDKSYEVPHIDPDPWSLDGVQRVHGN